MFKELYFILDNIVTKSEGMDKIINCIWLELVSQILLFEDPKK